MTLPEITVKAVILGLLLSVLLGAANTYLGLKAGLTVAAAIPAAVVSMAVLRAFRRNNILENNMVQTIASAGTAVASGAIFTIPALIILGHWTQVNYWTTTAVAACGGLLGVLFTIPIRRALIIDEKLPFPEGVATGEVLKAGAKGGTGIAVLAVGGILGAIYKGLESGLHIFSDTASATIRMGKESLMGVGMTLSPALMGVGAIIGLRIALLVFLGGVLGWVVGIPLYTLFGDDVYSANDGSGLTEFFSGGKEGDASLRDIAGSVDDLAAVVWSRRIRYVGVGAMLVGGVWSLIKLRKPLARAVTQGLRSTRAGAAGGEVPRTEREISFRTVLLGIVAIIIPITLLYGFFTDDWVAAGIMAAIMVVTGFLFSAVGGYMAGLVGSSNTPISGVTILTLLVAAGALLALGFTEPLGPAAAILVAAVIAIAGAIASDNLQDLKAGHIVGATPRKQQMMLMVGAVASAFVIAPVINVLIEGTQQDLETQFGRPFTAQEAIGTEGFPAPQAGLMASVSAGIFGSGVPYGMIAIGALLAVALILVDGMLQRRGSTFRTPVMPVAVGIYLPVGLSVPIFAGGLMAELAERYVRRRTGGDVPTVEAAGRSVILYGSGLIAGEALMGILTAVMAAQGLQATWVENPDVYSWAGLALMGYLVFLAYYIGIRPVLARRGSGA